MGGVNPYLGLFARAGIRREQVDADVAALNILELPTARGCTYVLGAEDFAWALTLGQGAAEATVKVLAKFDVARAEVHALERLPLRLLQNAGGPLEPQQLKAQLGDAVRSLGEDGKKKGVSTTLPTVLGLLQADGRIRRVPLNGRLDQRRYAYTAWGLAPASKSPEQVRAKLLKRYLGWTGGATLKQTQWFTAFSVAQTKVALADSGAGQAQIQLLAGTDALFLLRRNAAENFAPEDHGRKLLSTTLALQADLPDHPIVDRGRIIGLWQYDPGKERIAHRIFGTPTQAGRQRIQEVEAFIREDLGDFRSFSLDSPTSRQKRIDALNAAEEGSS